MDIGSSPSSSRSTGGVNQEVTCGVEFEIYDQDEGEAVNNRTVLQDSVLAGAAASAAVVTARASDADENSSLHNAANGPSYTALFTPRTGMRTACGRRKEMEDAVSVVHHFLSVSAHPDAPSPHSDLHFYGVYDGHGGAQAAIHCREHLHLALAEEVRRGLRVASLGDLEGWERIMKATFLRMDREVGSHSSGAGGNDEQQGLLSHTSSDTVGSTAIVAVLSCHHIIVANCGDSRAVLCRRGQAIALSTDHKPEREDEMARIEAAGGRVICWNGWRVLGVLAMSRAIGDHFLKPYVIADPDVTMTVRSEEDECLILASDGLWDVVNNQDACTIASRCLAANREAQAAASALAHTAHEKGSSDNISVVVVDLRPDTRNVS